jgi:hypothetical protein
VVISVEAACVNNAILLNWLTSKVVLQEPEIRSTDRNIPIDKDSTNDQLHFGMPGGSGDDEEEAEASDVCDAIPTISLQRWPATEFERFNLGSCDFDGYEGQDGDDGHVDADVEEQTLQADDGSTQNVEDLRHRRFDL